MNPIATTISDRGDVRLPPDVLLYLGLSPNDRVELIMERGAVRIIPADDKEPAAEARRHTADRAARRRAALSQISAAFPDEPVEIAEQAISAAIAEVRAESLASRRRPSDEG